MQLVIMPDKVEMGKAAARAGAELLRHAIEERGSANIIVATGASQFTMLSRLVKEPNVAWHRVTGFHLDEYVGLSITHPASFRRYLWERFVSQLPLPLAAFHYLSGEKDPRAECDRVGELISNRRVDVAFVGIGENAHLAFNDPPADFKTQDPYIVVRLDEACRRQQLGEGWFPTLDDVPREAISMSVRQIMKSGAIICTVPDERKAGAVRNAVEGEVTPQAPASILQRHNNCTLFVDEAAASQLSNASRQPA